jgi:hypothetical protein
MTKTWTQRIAALMFALAIVVSTSVFAEDDVFVDEGDGDFDTMPVAPQAEEKKAEPTAPVAQKAAPAPEMSAVEEELATPTIVEEKTTDAPALSNEDLFNDEDPAAKPVAQEEKPAPVKKAAPAKEKKVAAKAPAKKEKKVAKHSPTKAFKKGKGYFAWTADVCKMVRSPASTKGLGETRASKKIWVEDVDSKWVKVWNKDGKEAFLSRDCLK